MSKKKQATLGKEQHISNKKLVMLSAILAIMIALGFSLAFMLLQTPNRFSMNAAIVDQLGKNLQNAQFVNEAASILEAAGFNVTYYESEKVNVAFFRQLAKDNYGIIILRVHSALRLPDNATVDFFTSEEFSESNYLEEIQNGLLTKGNYSSEPGKFYFTITSKFIESLEGRFPRSVVIAMGCSSLKQGCEQMAEAFIKKGAEAYIGWTEAVEINHTDRESLKLLRMLVQDDETIEEATDNIDPYYYFDPLERKMRKSEMRYNPSTAANLRLSSLIAEAKSSSNNQSAITFFEPVKAFSVTNSILPKNRKEVQIWLVNHFKCLEAVA